MPYILDLAPNERLRADIDYAASEKSGRFRFAVTDHAFYIPATKFVVAGDPTYFKSVPIAHVESVEIEAIKPYGFYVFSVLMVLAGLFILGTAILPGAILTPQGIGWSLAILVGGVLLSIAGQGRYRLAVRMGKETYRWVPPLVVFPQDKRQLNEVLDTIVKASTGIGVRVEDARPRAADRSG